MLKIKDLDKEKYKIIEKENYYISYVNQKSQEWFDLRKGRITGTMIGKIVGNCKFNKLEGEDLAKYIKGEFKIEHSNEEIERMNKGNEFEDVAREKFKKIYFEENNIEYKEETIGMIINKENEENATSPDGYFECYDEEEKRIIKIGLEIKCPRYLPNCLVEDDYIYLNYLDQMLWYYKIAMLDKMIYFVYSWETGDYYMKEIDINREKVLYLFSEGKKFYEKYLK